MDTLIRHPRVSLVTIALAYLRVGATAFGFTILRQLTALVLKRGWLTDEELNEGLALVQLYPGPIMVDLTAYSGYKLRGVIGAVMATTCFVLPSFILMLVLSALYFAVGSLPWVHTLFLGLEALVIGVIAQVTLDLGARNIQGRAQAAIALAAFIAVVLIAIVGVQNTASEFGAFVAHSGMARSRPFAMMLTQYYAQRQSWDGAQALIADHAAWMSERTVLVNAQDVVVADSENSLIGQKFNPNAADTLMDIQVADPATPSGVAGRVVGRVYLNPSVEGARLGTDFLQGTTRGLIFAGLAASLVAALLSFLVARRITAPVRALTTAARRMADGDLNQRVKVTSSDEIAELGNAFNTMASSLARTDQLRRNLVADVAHELRTPLTSVLGSLEAMRDGVAQPTPAFLDSAYEEGLLLKRLVNDLQELSLAEAGQIQLDRGCTSLTGIVEGAARAVVA